MAEKKLNPFGKIAELGRKITEGVGFIFGSKSSHSKKEAAKKTDEQVVQTPEIKQEHLFIMPAAPHWEDRLRQLEKRVEQSEFTRNKEYKNGIEMSVYRDLKRDNRVVGTIAADGSICKYIYYADNVEYITWIGGEPKKEAFYVDREMPIQETYRRDGTLTDVFANSGRCQFSQHYNRRGEPVSVDITDNGYIVERSFVGNGGMKSEFYYNNKIKQFTVYGKDGSIEKSTRYAPAGHIIYISINGCTTSFVRNDDKEVIEVSWEKGGRKVSHLVLPKKAWSCESDYARLPFEAAQACDEFNIDDAVCRAVAASGSVARNSCFYTQVHAIWDAGNTANVDMNKTDAVHEEYHPAQVENNEDIIPM